MGFLKKEILMAYISRSCDLPKNEILMASVDPLSKKGNYISDSKIILEYTFLFW